MALRLLRCEKDGLRLAVNVKGIDGIVRDEARPGGSMLVVVENGERTPVPVSHVRSLIEVEESDVLPLPEGLRAPDRPVLGVVRHGGELLLCVVPSMLVRPPEPAKPRPFHHPRADAPPAKPGSFVEFVAGTPKAGAVPVRWAVLLAQVLEVLESVEMLPCPGAPASVEGVVAWRDQIAPVINLAVAVGLSPEPGGPERHAEETRYMVARGTSTERPVILPIYTDLRPVASGEADPVDPSVLGIAPGAVRGAFRRTDSALLIPDLDSMV